MLSIYRVISLSLLMSLFFAAPLLCVHPAAIHQQKTQALAAKRQQGTRATVAWQRTTHSSYVRASDRLANSLREVEYVHGQDEDWDSDERENWDDIGVTPLTDGVSTTSRSSYY